MSTSAENEYGSIDAHPVIAHGDNFPHHIVHHASSLPLTGASLIGWVLIGLALIVVGYGLTRKGR